jgi:N-acetylneuraminic acid mutarotase
MTQTETLRIVSPSHTGTYQTERDSEYFSGTVSTPAGAVCDDYSGGHQGTLPDGYQVTWSNAATSAEGNAFASLTCQYKFIPLLGYVPTREVIWQADVALAAGDNTIVFTATYTSVGEGTLYVHYGQATIVVTRVEPATPPPTPPTPPAVVATSPSDGATCVQTENWISATFSRPIDPSTLSSGTFTLKDSMNNLVSGSAAVDVSGTGFFIPQGPLANSTFYTATITTGVKDDSGTPLAADYPWSFMTQSAGTGIWSPLSSVNTPSARTRFTSVWAGTQMMVWGGYDGFSVLSDGARYDPRTDNWSPVSTIVAPEAREGHVSVWTGSKVIVWGGVRPGAWLNSGGVYDAATDSWSPMATTGAPSGRAASSAVWTGTEMIVWGGYAGNASGQPILFADGARYNPSTNSWSPISSIGAPSARSGQTAVWTGSAMIVWGGSPLSPASNIGGVYAPSSDSWVATSSVDAPSPRSLHTAVWTGTEMIIWGGNDGTASANSLNTGARFNPASNSWKPMSTLCAPVQRDGHAGVWSGTELLVWGGGNNGGVQSLVTGGRYNPASDTWQAIPVLGAPQGRLAPAGLWTGSAFVLWGGRDPKTGATLNSGGRYQPY